MLSQKRKVSQDKKKKNHHTKKENTITRQMKMRNYQFPSLHLHKHDRKLRVPSGKTLKKGEY